MRDRDSGPPREGGRSTSSAHLRRVTWSFSADIHVSRYVSEKDTVRMLACVSHIQKALSARYMAEPTKITITRSTKMNIAVPHEARFMNICGKITHISPYKGVAKERREERAGGRDAWKWKWKWTGNPEGSAVLCCPMGNLLRIHIGLMLQQHPHQSSQRAECFVLLLSYNSSQICTLKPR